MTPKLPDPQETAAREAERINSDRNQFIYHPLDRTMKDAPWVDRQSLVAGLEDFHRERMQKIPSVTKYPESRPWVNYIFAVESELRRLANLNDLEIALYRSLGFYTQFRGFVNAKPVLATSEKCRVAYLPETDQKALHIKNVDDPLTFWKPMPPLPPQPKEYWWDKMDWTMDGVGSGLHIDDEPEDIFPLPALNMVGLYANNVPSVLEFLRRYSPFWGGGNLVIYDRQKRSAAIEKCSYNFMEVFEPGNDGQSHISGMVCRDPASPQGRYQKAKRDQYRKLYNLAEDGPDGCFWKKCDQVEEKLAQGLKQVGPRPKAVDVIRLFVTPWPEGLCKDGAKFHPDQSDLEYTLLTNAHLLEKRRTLRWQRSQDGKTWPREPEVSSAE